MWTRKYFESVGSEIEADGAIRRVIHNQPNRAAEGWKRLRNSAGLTREFRKFLPNAGNCLLGVAQRDRCKSKSMRKSRSIPMKAATKIGCGTVRSVRMMACGLNAARQTVCAACPAISSAFAIW